MLLFIQCLLKICSQKVEDSLQSTNIYTDDQQVTVSDITREVKFICQGLKCNSSSDPHYLLPIANQTCEIPVECDRSRDYRKLTRDESYWFPGNSEGEITCIEDTYIVFIVINPAHT